jgi:hypothetical protein
MGKLAKKCENYASKYRISFAIRLFSWLIMPKILKSVYHENNLDWRDK